MTEAVASRTALRVALRRAAHQVVDRRPLVLDDPYAIRILGPYAEELGRTPDPGPGRKPRPHSAALRAFLVARSRYAEDALERAVAEGVRQYVLLGAGLDTFAYRNRYAGLRVFEVDRRATQEWKRSLLDNAGMAHPDGLTYAPVDFERESPAHGLAEAGYDGSAPGFFAWLGVVPYLTLAAFRATVSFVAGQPAGSGVVFDYSQPRGVLSSEEQMALDSLMARVKGVGEPFRLFLTPREAAAELSGFRGLVDVGTSELNRLYCNERADGLRLLGSAGRIVTAWV